MQAEAFFKTIMTISIWLVMGVISGMTIMFSDGNYNVASAAMTIIPLLLAFGATKEIFVNRTKSAEQDVEKAKRDAGMSTLDVLMNMMDEHEREAFKETLKHRVLGEMRLTEDGELSYSADMLAEMNSEKRLRQ